MTSIRISEIFGPTIQGEGALIGQPTIFVRTGGCDYRCTWCDTLHAVDTEYRDQWQSMTSSAVWDQITKLSNDKPLMITLSGGNPAIQPLGPLIKKGHAFGYRFAMETRGSVSKDWFADLDMLVLSPKPPSSGMIVDWELFGTCIAAAKGKPQVILKIVVFDDVDYAFAKDVSKKHPDLPIYLQPGNHTPPPADDDTVVVDQDGLVHKMTWLVEKVTDDQWFNATVLPQLHVMLWGNKRGV